MWVVNTKYCIAYCVWSTFCCDCEGTDWYCDITVCDKVRVSCPHVVYSRYNIIALSRQSAWSISMHIIVSGRGGTQNKRTLIVPTNSVLHWRSAPPDRLTAPVAAGYTCPNDWQVVLRESTPSHRGSPLTTYTHSIGWGNPRLYC
jgi:hypothetical protein